MDFNVDSYTTEELMELLDLSDDATVTDITNKSDDMISNLRAAKKSKLADFFQQVQQRLLVERQTSDWFKYQALPQTDDVQQDKNTNRVHKVDVYNDESHLPMNREQLGVNNTHEVPVVQDTLNPNLKNVTTRFINIDSQFRQASGGIESDATDYTMDLSDPLTDVLSLKLYSIQIPYTWYTIDPSYGNTCLWVTNAGNSFTVTAEPGNYTPSEFCAMMNRSAFAQFTYGDETLLPPSIVTYNSSNGKITLNLTGWKDPQGNLIECITQFQDTFDHTANPYITFFDISGGKSCYANYSCSSQHHTFDGTLGWLMGFRLPMQPLFNGSGNTASAVLNLYGTKYFIVVLDDYNQNHINSGLVTITELSKTLALPSYYTANQPYICTGTTGTQPMFDLNAVGQLSNDPSIAPNLNSFYNALQDKLGVGVGQVPQLLPSAPRTLTQAQLYTVNEILKNRNKSMSFRTKAPTNSDTFAIIPIKYGSMSTGQLYTELSGQFQDNKRTYFGPVDIERLRIRLLDDRGNTVNLNGADWCITLLSENLYQY